MANNDMPESTRFALKILLVAANVDIPEKSSCKGDYGQIGQEKIINLLAAQLAYLNDGENKISGECKNNSCYINIYYAAGEDIYFAKMKYMIKNNQIKIDSLQCFMTP